jgi:hypothetical protein
VGDVFGADDTVKSGGFHFSAPEAKAGEVRIAGAQFEDELGAVMVTACFTGGEEDARIVTHSDEISVNFPEEIA